MSSIFSLKTDASQLPSLNEGTSKMIYEQHPPLRAINGSNFPNGQINIRWQNAGTKWWIPSRSYIRIRCRINAVRADAGAAIYPILNSDVAPNMNLAANLFQDAEFRIADKTVSRISAYMAQVDTLEKRLNKSKSWLDSAGKLTLMQADYSDRQNIIAWDGVSPDNQEKYGDFVTGVEMGWLGATTLAIAATDGTQGYATGTYGAGNLLTGAAGGILHPGDIIMGSDDVNAADRGKKWEVVQVLTATTVLVKMVAPAANGDAVNATAANMIQSNTRYSTKQHGFANDFEVIWQPSLSIFKVGHAMPAGKYELLLTPQTTSAYVLKAVESSHRQLKALQNPTIALDVNFEVVDMYLYLATVEGPRVDDATYMLSLEETRCQTDNIDSGVNGLQQKNFDVSPSTYALTCAFQRADVDSNTIFSASKFNIGSKINDITSGVTRFEEASQSLQRLFIQYAGQNKPKNWFGQVACKSAAVLCH